MGVFDERAQVRPLPRDDNPFAPRPGAVPPVITGRDQPVDQLLDVSRPVAAGQPGGVLLLTAPRGLGKTTLLVEADRHASSLGATVVRLEAEADTNATARRLLAQTSDRIGRSGLADLARRITGLTVGPVGVELAPEADHQTITLLLLDLARSSGGLLVLIDEAQQNPTVAAAAVRAAHRGDQDGVPIGCVLAGLPGTVRAIVDEVSYAERYPIATLRSLDAQDAFDAIATPLRRHGIELPAQRRPHVATVTGGYPYFVQLLGAAIWDHHDGSPTVDAVRWRDAVTTAATTIEAWLSTRFDRLPDGQQQYLRAAARTGPWPVRTGAVAAELGTDHASLSSVRARLIADGLLWSPGYGLIDLVIPPLGPWLTKTDDT